MRRVVFRTDASIQIGTGHIMRCLVLANELKQAGFKVHFICCQLPGDLCSYLERHDYSVHRLSYMRGASHHNQEQKDIWEEDLEQTRAVLQLFEGLTQWLIVDHYKLDEKWETGIRSFVQKIMVIDDLADRRHNCDVLLDQNLYKEPEQRYYGLTPRDCQTLFGPEYALLRPEFQKARANLRVRDGKINNILVFYGGTDPTGETGKALDAIIALKNQKNQEIKDVNIDVVVGNGNPERHRIHKKCESIPNTTFHCQVNYMADLMGKADLALGAGGSSTWERCCMALPSIVTVTAKNQLEMSEYVASLGAIRNLGWHSDVKVEMIKDALEEMLLSPSKVFDIGKKAEKITEAKFQEKENPLALIFKEDN